MPSHVPPTNSRPFSSRTLLFPLCALLGAGGTLGCGGSPEPEHPVASPASAAPIESATAASSASVPVSAVKKVAPTPFVAAFRSDLPLILNDVSGTMLVVNGTDWASGEVFRVETDGVHPEAHLFDGVNRKRTATAVNKTPFLVYRIGGTFPDKLTVDVNFVGERGGENVTFQQVKGKWAEMADHRSQRYLSAMYLGGLRDSVPLPDGGLLYESIGSTVNEFGQAKDDLVTIKVDNSKRPVPVKALGTIAGCPSRFVEDQALQAFADGSILGVGQECQGEGDRVQGFGHISTKGPLGVERWKAGETKAEVTMLPGAEVMTAGQNAFSVDGEPNDTWVGALVGADTHQYLAHFDGSKWTEVTPPSKAHKFSFFRVKGAAYVASAEATLRWENNAWKQVAGPISDTDLPSWFEVRADGTIWSGAGPKLYRLPVGAKEFEEVALPAVDGKPLVAQGAKPIWLPRGEMVMLAQGADDAATFVLSDTAKYPTFVAPPPPPLDLKLSISDVKPAGPGCTTPFAILYGITKYAGPNFDFPATRKALKGKTEFGSVQFAETKDGEQRFLVGRVTTVDQGRKLVKAITDGVKGSKPQLLCGDPPETVREVKFDLVNGVMLK